MTNSSNIESIKDAEVLRLIHELCNPLTISTSLVEIMLSNPDVEKLDEIHENLMRVSLTVEELKSYLNIKPE